MKPVVYIAGPFFNPEQIALIVSIEKMLSRQGIEFYSPRLHSGSADLSPEDRARPEAWDSVFRSNITAIHTCDAIIAVLDYLPSAFPKIPDTGTIFELGYANALNKLTIGFFLAEPEKLNLMLSHGVKMLVYGLDTLECVVGVDSFPGNASLQSSFQGEIE